MKRSVIAKLIFIPLLFWTAANVFAFDESDATDFETTAEENVEEDDGIYAKDSFGNFVHDSSGKKVRVGTRMKAAPVSAYVPPVNNTIEIERDDIRLILNGNDGTFAIYGVAEKGNRIPLLSTNDANSGSYFSVKIGRKEYKLQTKLGIKCEARNTPLGAQMAYLVSNDAQVVVDFSFMPSIATSTRIDMLRVSVFVINIGRSIQSFAVKGIFDTILGENTPAHFSTAAKKFVNSEVQLQSMDDDLWIRSANRDAAIQFIFGSKEITKTDFVTLASRSKMDSVTWVPSVQTSRSFNSVTSFNNSAVCVNWPSIYLDALRTGTFCFYISVATGGNNPAGKQFLIDLDNGKTALGVAAKNSAAKLNGAADPIPLTQEEVDSVTPNILNSIPSSSKEAFVKTKEITEAQLDPDYIQDLLDRISVLNENESMDKAELKRLNEELDLILNKLGAKR
ncbi:hypothetical protein [Treponema sp.]|uniref:hypothetical protein n=1 Tax=Treponema sp. TaxID=166 RepID=UPI00298E5AFF|nr:hypothetical protein [Treponema sp.]MCQ2240472.1 hypothetical protein [Treponema sp.]